VARAYRRRPAPGELEAVLALHDARAADGFEAGLGAAIEAILIAPQFLFRSLDGGAGALDDHALAARLSYFLWRTMPDAELRALADAGRLRERTILEAEVRRMLADPRVSGLVDVLTTQWLALRGLEGAAPSRDRYAVFYDDDLRPAMARETSRFVLSLVRTGGTLGALVTAPYTFVDDKLARLYGLGPAPGDGSVDLAGTERRGVLGHASFLTMNANADRTSIVKRGKWVLSALLCTTLPDPPANVAQQLPAGATPLGQRERLARHREATECRSCHRQIDPPGLALEGFDRLGRGRTVDEDGLPIDPSGALADGRPFAGAPALAELIAEDPRFAACVTRNLLTYALARELDDGAACEADALAAAAPARERTFADLIVALVGSRPFLGQAPEPTP
jgi:hypothetical protein